MTDRWQKFSSLEVNEATLAKLASSCDEFLVHGVDVEGMKLGIDEELVSILGRYSPIPVTYAGGARTLVSCRPRDNSLTIWQICFLGASLPCLLDRISSLSYWRHPYHCQLLDEGPIHWVMLHASQLLPDTVVRGDEADNIL